MSQFLALVMVTDEKDRAKSKKANILHKISGRALIEYVYSSIEMAGIEKCLTVTDNNGDQLKECLKGKIEHELLDGRSATAEYLINNERLREGQGNHIVVLMGDMPLITPQTISHIMKHHILSGNTATIVTKALPNKEERTKVICESTGRVKKILTYSDSQKEFYENAYSVEQEKEESLSGIFCFVVKDFIKAVSEIDSSSLKESLFEKTIDCLLRKDLKVGAFSVNDPEELMRIEDRAILSEAAKIMRSKVAHNHMLAGVTIIDPETTYIDFEVKIGIDTVIYPGTIIEGNTVIGEDCIIGPNSRIDSSYISNSVEIKNSIVLQSKVGNETRIGPFAYLRPGSEIGSDVKIGDFVEIKKSRIGNKTSVAHLTYIGDAEIGNNVNMGCGVIVVNYDGKEKHKTTVEDNAFVGCNVNLISPVVVRNNAFIAAGSTITDEVPENSLAIARNRQIIKEDWVGKRGMKENKNNS